MVSHTKGPWHALDSCVSSGLHIRGGDHHYPIANVKSYWDGPGPREDEAKANYALIAAAPDLLAVACALELFVRQREDELGCLSPEMERLAAQNRAAIARATGAA